MEIVAVVMLGAIVLYMFQQVQDLLGVFTIVGGVRKRGLGHP